MKKILFIVLFAVTGLSTYAQSGYRFSIDTLLPHTEIKNQYRSSTCWCFSTLSFIESEIIRTKGDSINLSERYLVRNLYPVKIQKYLSTEGKSTLSGGSLAHDVMNTIATVGVIPEQDHPEIWGKVKGGNNTKKIKYYLDSALSSGTPQAWIDSTTFLLNEQYGPFADESIVNNGISYCEGSLELNPQNYVEITSFTHHPFYKKFTLEIPDNFSGDQYYNVPLNEFEEIVDNSLKQGYTIGWDGDVSEPTFIPHKGLAILPDMNQKANLKKSYLKKPNQEIKPTQELRQEGFDNHSTEDDHLMHIVGLAHDQDGTKYYIIKNSWGPIGPYGGFLYMSASYFYMKTIAVIVNKEVIPTTIRTKLKLRD